MVSVQVGGFLSTLSLRRATWWLRCWQLAAREFLSTLSLRRATPGHCGNDRSPIHFYPRSPCGERLPSVPHNFRPLQISIHALLAESDSPARVTPTASRNFYPRSPCGERLTDRKGRAFILYFYPRSPCGERRCVKRFQAADISISIHALLAESDEGPAKLPKQIGISIHALLAESDTVNIQRPAAKNDFYPRSPCGERQRADSLADAPPEISIHALLAESDVNDIPYQREINQFLSTLSLRRATLNSSWISSIKKNFYPRSPCGERQYAHKGV